MVADAEASAERKTNFAAIFFVTQMQNNLVVQEVVQGDETS